MLPGCCAVLSCSAHGVHNVGDHYVWYGHVVNITRSTKETPLLYYARYSHHYVDYCRLFAFPINVSEAIITVYLICA